MKSYYQLPVILLVFGLANTSSYAEKMDTFRIYPDGNITTRTKIKFPTWFKTSFFDLREELTEARQAGKRGIIVMFSQERCSTCLAFIRATLGDPQVKERVMDNYYVIGMDIFSDLEVTDPNGSVTTVKDFAEQKAARLTPTILFYGIENAQLLKIIGFYPPEKFQHVLDYIDSRLYMEMRLSDYLRDKRIKSATTQKEVLRNPFFTRPPIDLASSSNGVKRPTLVLFETPNCNPCRRFHTRVLTDVNVRRKLASFRAVQLDASDNSSEIVTPDGRRLTPKQWFKNLQLSYDVAVVFLDEQGKEVLRHDAEIGRLRMAFTMDYVLQKGYLKEQQVLRWRRQNLIKQAAEERQNRRF